MSGEQLMASWAQGPLNPYPHDELIHEIVRDQARRRPNAPCLVMGERRLTYAEVVESASRVARGLRSIGVRPSDVVGVMLERSPEMIIAWLGTLMSGAGYAPLDPTYPRPRLSSMLRTLAPRAIIVDRASRPAAPAGVALLDVARLEDVPVDPGETPGDAEPEPRDGGSRIAYVMYTSGSTGRPKGVEIPHRGVLRLLLGADYVYLGPEETLLHAAAPSFDAATFEVWGALLHGGTCVVAPPGPIPPEVLGRVIADGSVTTAWLTSAQLNVVIDEAPSVLKPLRQLVFGGEAASVAHVRRALHELPGTTLVNGYGPTESTTFACCYRVPRTPPENMRTVPIGRPIANTCAYVLDPERRMARVGEVGELYLGGDGLALGYRNDLALTARAFVDVPLEAGPQRLYRTGDLVRWSEHGLLEYVGRDDDQIKVRGFRVEPGDIVAALVSHPGVEQAVVAVRGDGAGRHLVGYYVQAEGKPSAEDLRGFLRARLPRYLIPNLLVPCDDLPLNAHGKVDLDALRSLESREREHAATDSAASPDAADPDREVARIWGEVLGSDQVSPDEHFFECGGTSLLLQPLHRRLQRLAGRRFPIIDLLEHTTMRQQARYLSGLSVEHASSGREEGRCQ